VNRHRCQPVVF